LYFNWLDRWDERRAQRGEKDKKTSKFILDAQRAFPSASKVDTIANFCNIAGVTTANPTFFEQPKRYEPYVERIAEGLKFPSGMTTDVKENNIVWAKVTESGSLDRALLIFHHWNANSRNSQIAKFLSRRGITVVEISMPYHFERSRRGASHADYMLSPNLGRTIQALQQAVWDGRTLISWLKGQGYGEVSVLGMSLGSWVAGLVAAHDSSVAKASLFLTAGSLADMVWTGRATQSIRHSLEPSIDRIALNKAWDPLNLENYTNKLSRPDLDLQVVLATRDRVVLPELSERLIERLADSRASMDVLRLNCGHYSLAMPPSILFAGRSLARFLRNNR
jgi:dienelactone hydrolase